MIRSMVGSDRSDFLRMTREFYGSHAVLHDIPDAFHEAAFDEMLSQSPYMSGYMIEADSKNVGYAVISRTYSHEAGGVVLWLEELFIDGEYRSRGLGKEFFAYVDTLCGEGVGRIRLETEPDNRRAQALYESLGFTRLDYIQYYRPLRTE